MFRARLSAAVVVFGALIALALVVAVPRASAVEPFPEPPKTMLTPHFAIHYTTDPASAAYITQQQVTDIAGWAERAYALYASWGYPAPPAGAQRPGSTSTSLTSAAVHRDLRRHKAVGGPTNAEAAAQRRQERARRGHQVRQHGGTPPGRARGLQPVRVRHLASRPTRTTTLAQAGGGRVGGLPPRRLQDARSRPASPSATTRATASAATAEPSGYDRAGDPGWTFMEYLSERYGADTSSSSSPTVRRRPPGPAGDTVRL